MAIAAGAALDYSNASTHRYRLQSIADAAAMAGAREFRLGNASEQVIRDSVANHAAQRSETSTRHDRRLRRCRQKSATALSRQVSTYVMHLTARSSQISVIGHGQDDGRRAGLRRGTSRKRTARSSWTKSAKLSAPTAPFIRIQIAEWFCRKNSATMTPTSSARRAARKVPTPGSFAPSPGPIARSFPIPCSSRPMPTPTPAWKRTSW